MTRQLLPFVLALIAGVLYTAGLIRGHRPSGHVLRTLGLMLAAAVALGLLIYLARLLIR